MRILMIGLLAMIVALPAQAVSRVELDIGRIEGADWQAQKVHADWQLQGPLSITVANARSSHGSLPAVAASLSCTHLETVTTLVCRGGRLSLQAADSGQLRACFDARLSSFSHWRFDLATADLTLNYNDSSGKFATEALQLTVSGQVAQAGAQRSADLHLQTRQGQAYVEPIFFDFAAHPLQADARLRWRGAGTPVQVDTFKLAHDGIAQATISGEFSSEQPLQRHRLDARIEQAQLAALATLYARPLLAGTRFEDVSGSGSAQFTGSVIDGQPQRADLRLQQAALGSTRLGLQLNGLEGELHWQQQGNAAPSTLAWHDGSVGALPLGATQLQLQLAAQGLRLLAPARIPLLDGAIAVQALAVDGLGSESLSGDFNAALEPIDLALLSRTLGWPEFGGQLSGRIPGLSLRNRELSLEGALTATAFDGEITVSNLKVLDPLGVLPRLRGDLRLRRLDLAAITGAFSFGKITGRLDGDINDLRLLGWEPVAMKARFYSTPGDRSTRRISQRAIDNISAIGGGPTGILSRGALSFFKDFAYARMGWSCILDNGVCHMDGVAPAPRGNGYILVEGRLLPRIDVIGYSRQVSWNVFLQQLMSVRSTEGVKVEGP